MGARETYQAQLGAVEGSGERAGAAASEQREHRRVSSATNRSQPPDLELHLTPLPLFPNRQVAGLLVLGSLFNLMLDSTLCDMRRADPYGAAGGAYVPAADVADSLERNDGRAGMAGAQCSAGANAAKLALSVAVAVTYCYLAWITYCYRRGLEQGSQLDDDVAAMAEAAAEGMAGRAKPRGGASGDGGGDGGRGASVGVGGFGGGYIEDGPGEMEIPVRARLGEMRAR